MGFFITQAYGTDERVRYHRETRNGSYVVKDSTMGGERVRLLLVNGVQESATHLDPGRKYEPLFRYLTFFQEIVESHPHPERVLLIGGAGFAYPKLFFSSGQRGSLAVVEMDPRMIRLARRFFFLDDLEREYDLRDSERLKIHVNEGLDFLEHTEEKWDVILNDAYLGNTPDAGLLSDRGIAACRAHLEEDGILALNIITPLAGEDAMRGIMARKRFEEYFSRVDLYPCDPTHAPTMRQNCMLTGR
ncbi:MAG: fused MFS/spermidine synthase [Lachnospiraceae bacterium]|nr:fused MFS/spermidine synthase [Lachnospiraceae bacterium]